MSHGKYDSVDGYDLPTGIKNGRYLNVFNGS